MTHSRRWLASLLLIAPFATFADTEWDNPADIPTTEPVTVGLAGTKPADVVRYLLAEGASSARMSPDGTSVAFRWGVTGEPQLWVVDAAGGFPRQLTFGGGITFFEWAPDGEHLIVGRDAEGNEREGYYLLSADGTEERVVVEQSAAYRVFGMFSPDGSRVAYASTERNGLDFDIYVADVDGGGAKLIYEGTFGYAVSAWQPGGDNVIVTEQRGEDAHDVHMLDLSTGRLTTLFRPDIAAEFTDFEWLPDGSGFYVATNLDREFIGLARYSLVDAELEFLETPNHDIGNVALSKDGRYLTWTTNEDGYSKLHAMDTRSGRGLPVPDLADGVYGVHMATGSAIAAVHVSGPATPGDVFVWDIASGVSSRAVAASLGGLDAKSFVAPESLRYPARDGIDLQGLLYLPDAET